MNRILIVEDNPRITDFLETGLQAHGFTTAIVKSGRAAIEMSDSQYFDLLLLDLGLPDIDGLAVIRELRGRGEYLPVIVLTARDGVEDTVTALEGGADDYITKPFRFEELLARIRVQLRNQYLPKIKEETKLRINNITLDMITRQIWVEGSLVNLTNREFILAEVFLRHPMQVMSREQLLDRVWGYDYAPGSNIVDVYIKNLRKKLGGDYIETVRGMGYRFQPDK
ncbi:response regulator transcription factor [Microcoleus sp. herbarium19]|uniref:response regulator transcription factor n=1 Tax=unclassified Microcoleus TaxID=2642155 RepID=UPI002FD2E4CE